MSKPYERSTEYTPDLVVSPGSINSNKARAVKSRQYMEVSGTIKFDGTPTATEIIEVSLPEDIKMDEAALVGGNDDSAQGADYLGSGQRFIAGIGSKGVEVLYSSPTTVKFACSEGMLSWNQMADGDSLKYKFSVPVKNW
jgi:hypothetical protein